MLLCASYTHEHQLVHHAWELHAVSACSVGHSFAPELIPLMCLEPLQSYPGLERGRSEGHPEDYINLEIAIEGEGDHLCVNTRVQAEQWWQ